MFRREIESTHVIPSNSNDEASGAVFVDGPKDMTVTCEDQMLGSMRF